MTHISILCKGSHQEGLGHLHRQMHLAKALQSKGIRTTVILKDYPPSKSLLKKNKLNFQTVQDLFKSSQKYLKNSDLIILDINDTKSGFIQDLKTQTRVVSFEDLGDGRSYVDLIVDCNLNPSEHPNDSENYLSLFGLSYSLIDPVFNTYHQKENRISEDIHSILITMGGTDPFNLSEPIARTILTHRPSLDLTILKGPGFKNHESLKNLEQTFSQVKVEGPLTSLADHLFNHDLIICSGGVTLHEALCVGSPTLVISQVEPQSKIARSLEEKGATYFLGSANNWNEIDLINKLNLSANQRKQMSEAGKKLIDGKGLDRIVKKIVSILGN